MIDRNKGRNQGESSDSASPSSGKTPNADSFGEVASVAESDSVVDEARRTSEAAGLAHWTAPPTGHVPKILDGNKSPNGLDESDDASVVGADHDGWGTSDLSDVFSEPESLTSDRTEISDGFGSRTRDPLVEFTGDVGPVGGLAADDPLADFAAIPGSVTRDPLADFEPTTNKNFTEEVPAVGSAGVPTPPQTAPPPVEASAASVPEVLDLTTAEQEDNAIELDDPAEAASRSELRPKHRTAAPQKRSVFDLPPAEQVSAAPSSAANARSLASRISEYDETVVGSRSGYEPEPVQPDRSSEQSIDLSADDQTRRAPLEDLLPPVSGGTRIDGEKQAMSDSGGALEAQLEVDGTRPNSDEDKSEAPAAGTGRDLFQATSVGLVLAALAGLALWAGAGATTCLIAAFAVLAVMEFYNAMTVAGLRPASLLGIIGVAAIQASIYFQGADAYPLVMSLIVVFGVLWYLAGADKERPVLNLGLTMMGLLWVGGLAGFGVLMVREPLGFGLLLTAILVTVVSDTLAYAGGRILGATPFHAASPNKTWEGTLTGFAGALFCGLVVGLLDIFEVFAGSTGKALILAAVVGLLAPIGDLAESMIKRDLGVKDMGTLLPGHGGVMDRLDGLLFALPGAYYVGLVFNLL